MARIRTIKPEFPQSESMGNISRDARLLFIQLWTICDDSGRARASSRMLASLLFPYDNDAPGLIDGWMIELEREGCLVRYEANNTKYLQVCKWLNHQKIDKPSASKIPPFDESSRTFDESSRTFSVGSKDLDLGSKDLKQYSVVNTLNDSLTCATLPTEEVSFPPTTDAGRACVVMRQLGITHCNPGHPTLLNLIASGTTVDEIQYAAIETVRRGKGFSYALGMLKKQREDAAKIPPPSSEQPRKIKSRLEQQRETLNALTTNQPLQPSTPRIVGASSTRLDE